MTQTIVHVIPGLGVGGAERMLIKLLGAATEKTPVHRVVSLRSGGALKAEMEAVAGPIIEIGVNGPIPTPAAAWRLRSAVECLRPSLVVGWMYHGNLAARFARQGRPTVWNIRQSIYGWRHFKPATTLTIRAGALTSRSARAIVYNSSVSARQHEAIGYSPTRALVMPNGFDVTRFATDSTRRIAARSLLGIPGDAPVIGLVARVHPFKGHDDFLVAADLVSRKRGSVHFVMIGTGTQEYLDIWRKSHPHSSPFLRAIGEVRDVSAWLPGLDVAVSSSVTEGFPNVIGEAMACGIPCVVTDVGDSAFVVGDTGVVVPPSVPVALANGIDTLLDMSPTQRRMLGGRARARVEREFALPAVAARYFGLYERILADWKDAHATG